MRRAPRIGSAVSAALGFVAFTASAQVTSRQSVDSGGIEADGQSFVTGISGDGRWIAFWSDATNLVASDTNAKSDCFVKDAVTGAVTRVSIRTSGVQANGPSTQPVISDDGDVTAFQSDAKNMVNGDLNNTTDVFTYEASTGKTTRVSVDSLGNEGNSNSYTARFSADGHFVAFYSEATNLVTGDTNAMGDVFRHDLITGETIRLSVDSTGAEGNGTSQLPWNSADGRYTAFTRLATNLVASDTNGVSDVFLRDSCVPADCFNYGTGWAGTLFTPSITPTAPPVFGTTITLNLDNSAGVSTTAVLMLGFTEANLPTLKGGSLELLPLMFIPLPLPPSGFGLTGTLPPMNPALCGFEVDFQAIELDAGATKGFAFTDGLALVLGI